MAEFEETCPICGYEYCYGKDFENCEQYQGDGKEMFFNMVTDFKALNKAETIEEKMKFCEPQKQIVKCMKHDGSSGGFECLDEEHHKYNTVIELLMKKRTDGLTSQEKTELIDLLTIVLSE
jgi:hypothetical protein